MRALMSSYEIAERLGKGATTKVAQRIAVSKFCRAQGIARVPGTWMYLKRDVDRILPEPQMQVAA